MSLVAVLGTMLVSVLIPGTTSAKWAGGVAISSRIGGLDLSNGRQLTGTVLWTASPKGAGISKVAFLVDGVSKWTENWSPYRFNGDPDGMLDTRTLSNGNHTLAVVAYTAGGAKAVAKASVKVSNAPALIVTSSIGNGSTLSGSLRWTAGIRGTTAQKVEFLVDGVSKWTENWSPYQFNGDPDGMLDTRALSNGNHTLAVVAYAASGAKGLVEASVRVSNSPAFTVTSSIGNGSTLNGSRRWTAGVQGGPVQKIEFMVDGVSKWTENWSPYQFNGDPDGVLDTTKLSNGPHTFGLVARASDGRIAQAQSTVTVSNSAVTVSNSAAPANGQQTYPNAPTDLHVTDSSQQTTLTAAWTAVSGAAGYRVGRNGTPLTDTGQTTYTWKGLACGTTYALSVQPEKSPKDTGGRIATISGSTAACAASSGAVESSGSPGGGGAGTSAANAFVGNFETGNVKPWQATRLGGVQCLNYGLASNSDAARGTLSVVNDHVAGGAYSGRFDLPPASTPGACELLRGRTIGMGDEWYSMEVRFPDNWQEPSKAGWGMAIAQLNFENVWGFPVGVIAHADSVDLVLQSGLCNSYKSGSPGCQFSSGIQGNVPRQHIIPPADFSTSTWHQLLIHVKWTNGNDGVIEGFHRVRGQTAWIPTVSYRGYPTLQRTSTYTPVASDRTTDKIGAYRGPSDFPISIWQDNFCQASTMELAETCF
jgi:hypothetical protein